MGLDFQRVWGVVWGLAVVLAGCGVTSSYRFADVTARLTATGTTTVGVSVVDRRQIVVSGVKPPDFVGVVRTSGDSYVDVITQSRQPLADAAAEAIGDSLRRKGYTALTVPAKVDAPESELMGNLLAAAPDVGIVVEIRSWKSDTAADVALKYDLSLRVVSPTGETVGTHRVTHHARLSRGSSNPAGEARRVVPEAFQKAIEGLLNHSRIVEAIMRFKGPAPREDSPSLAAAPDASLLGGLTEAAANRVPVLIPDICDTVDAMNRENQSLREAGKLPAAHPSDVKNTARMLRRCAAGETADNQCRVFLFLYDESPNWAARAAAEDALSVQVADTLQKCHHNEAARCKATLWQSVKHPPEDPTDAAELEVEAEACREFLEAIRDPDYTGNAPALAATPEPGTAQTVALRPVSAPPVPTREEESPVSTPPPVVASVGTGEGLKGTDETSPAQATPDPPQPAAPAAEPTEAKYLDMRRLKAALKQGIITVSDYRRHWAEIRQKLSDEMKQLKEQFRAGTIDKRQYQEKARAAKRRYEGVE